MSLHTVSTVLTAALLFKSSFVGAGLKREFTKARIFKIASIYGSYLRAGVIREAAVNTVDTVLLLDICDKFYLQKL